MSERELTRQRIISALVGEKSLYYVELADISTAAKVAHDVLRKDYISIAWLKEAQTIARSTDRDAGDTIADIFQIVIDAWQAGVEAEQCGSSG